MMRYLIEALLPYIFTGHIAFVSAYCAESSDARWGRVSRWTGTEPIVGTSAACPVAWRGEKVYIENYGVRWCEDTPRDDYINEKPHLDVYMNSREEALNHGIQTLHVWRIGR